MAIPPLRDSLEPSTEHHPCTLRVWFDTVIRLGELGYPPHVLATVVENILYHRPQLSIKGETLPATITTVELRALMAIYQPYLSFPVLTMDILAASMVHEYAMGLDFILPDVSESGDRMESEFWLHTTGGRIQHLAVSGLLFRGIDPVLALERYSSVLMPGGEPFSPAPAVDLITDMLEKDATSVQILSTVRWDSRSNQAHFFMADQDFKSMSSQQPPSNKWSLVLFRTDSYFIFTKPKALTHAQRLDGQGGGA